MFGRGILDKADLIGRLERMQERRAQYGETFSFDAYLGLTFASRKLLECLAPLVKNGDKIGFAKEMAVFQDRFRKAPHQTRKSIVHYIGKRHGKLESFDDLPRILELLKK